MSTRLLVTGVAAAAVALMATPLAAAVARRTGIVDRPGELKPQDRAVPYLGGVAVFLATVVGGALGRPLLLVPLGLALGLGVADDGIQIPPVVRLGGQVVIGATVAAIVPTRLSGPVGPVLVAAVAVLLMNGVNMIDGLDALAGSVVGVAAVALAWMLRGDARILAVALACGLAGFLVFNRPPARIYLGDGGAYLLGCALAVLLASAWAPSARPAAGVAGLIVVAIPAAEVLFAVVRRLRSRQSLVLGDRGHPYDRLRAAGWPVLAASALYAGIGIALAAVALVVARPAHATAAVVAAVVVALALLAAAAATGVLSPVPESSR